MQSKDLWEAREERIEQIWPKDMMAKNLKVFLKILECVLKQWGATEGF